MQNEYLEFGYLLDFEDDMYLLLIDSLIVSGTLGWGTPSEHQRGHLSPIKIQS